MHIALVKGKLEIVWECVFVAEGKEEEEGEEPVMEICIDK